MKESYTSRMIQYRGKWVRVKEEATGFVSGPKRYWVKAIESVAGFKKSEEFTVSARHVRNQIRRKK